MLSDQVHRSPGLTAIFNAVKKSDKNHLLDLGPCVASNFQFFSQLGCHFHFENFNESVQDYLQGKIVDHEKLVDVFLQSLKPGQRFDIVLAWDLFSFLPQDLIRQLYDKLEKFLKPNTLFYLLSYSGSQKPATPGSFKISNQYQICVRSDSNTVQNDARQTTVQMLKSMPKYFMLRSYLNHRGMQAGLLEQILSYQPEKTARHTVFSSAEVADHVRQLDTEVFSPSIEFLRTKYTDSRAGSVLDLCGRNTLNEEIWKKHFRDVYVSDMRQVLHRISGMSGGESEEYLRGGQYFDFEAEQVFDAIVVWDVLNYLNEEQLLALGERISRHAHDGTLLISMNYTGDAQPSQPRAFMLTDKGIGLHLGGEVTRARTSAVLSSMRIQKAFPGFFSTKTYAVKPGMLHGMGEYVFVFKDADTLRREKEVLTAEVVARRRLRISNGEQL